MVGVDISWLDMYVGGKKVWEVGTGLEIDSEVAYYPFGLAMNPYGNECGIVNLVGDVGVPSICS